MLGGIAMCAVFSRMNIWARLGIIIIVLAIFCVIATEVFKGHPELHAHKKTIAATLAGAATLIWLVGKVHGSNGDTTRKTDGLFTLRFCGSLIAGFGGIVSNITPIAEFVAAPQSILQLSAATHRLPQLFRRESAFARPRKENDKGPLRVQGIFYRERDSSAIINGKTVSVGDNVGTARVVAIERQSVTVEVDQQRRVLSL